MANIIFNWPSDRTAIEERLSPRKKILNRDLIRDISTIFESIEHKGDQAVKESTERFDGIHLDSIRLSRTYIERCVSGISPEFKSAIQTAISNIREVNQALMPPPMWEKEIREGTIIGEKTTPLELKNSGEILLGKYTPFSAANYAIGITAVLPTNGFARSFSGITCKDMMKTSTIGRLSRSALINLRPVINQLGRYEGLPSHVQASDIRFQNEKI